MQVRCSIVVSISACHTEDPGLIPGCEGWARPGEARARREDMARNERSPVEWLVASLNRKTTAAATSIEMQTRPVYGSKQKLILAGLEPEWCRFTTRLRAGPILQASPLTVVQVRLLERLLVETEDLKDKVVIGGALVLLYGCGRLSDGQRAVRMICDWDVEKKFDPSSFEEQGFIELQVLNHKTARSEKLKHISATGVPALFHVRA